MIWSADSGVSASAGNIIMKTQNWFVAEEIKTILVNGDGKVEATTERIRQKCFLCSGRSNQENGQDQDESRVACNIM